MKIPKPGDMFFTGFESDYGQGGIRYQLVEIIEVEGKIIDEEGREGRLIVASDGIGYDCFWSEKFQIFVYALE